MTLSKYRFNQFSDAELYIIKRALIEAQKYIYISGLGNYTEAEQRMMNNLLREAIDNINWRQDNK